MTERIKPSTSLSKELSGEKIPKLSTLPYISPSPGLSVYVCPEGINFSRNKEARFQEIDKLMDLHASTKEISQLLKVSVPTSTKSVLEILNYDQKKFKEYKREIAYQSILQKQEQIDKLLTERKISISKIAKNIGVSYQVLPEFLIKYMGRDWVDQYEEKTNKHLNPEKKEAVYLNLLYYIKECFSPNEIYKKLPIEKSAVDKLVSERLGINFPFFYINFLTKQKIEKPLVRENNKSEFQETMTLLISRQENIIKTWNKIKKDIDQSFSLKEIQEKYFIDSVFLTQVIEIFIPSKVKVRKILARCSEKKCPIVNTDSVIDKLIEYNMAIISIAQKTGHSPETITSYIKETRGFAFYQDFVKNKEQKNNFNKNMEIWPEIKEDVNKNFPVSYIRKKYHKSSRTIRALMKKNLSEEELTDYNNKEKDRKSEFMTNVNLERKKLKLKEKAPRVNLEELSPDIIQNDNSSKKNKNKDFKKEISPKYFKLEQENLFSLKEIEKLQPYFNKTKDNEETEEKNNLKSKNELYKDITDCICLLKLTMVDKNQEKQNMIEEVIKNYYSKLNQVFTSKKKYNRYVERFNHQLEDFHDFRYLIQSYFNKINKKASQETINMTRESIESKMHNDYFLLIDRIFPSVFSKK
jgi:hypothetical protein